MALVAPGPAHAEWTSLGGLIAEPDWVSPAGLRKLGEDRSEGARAKLLELLHKAKTWQPGARLELLRAADPWVSRNDDPELTLALVRLFAVRERPDLPLDTFAIQTAAMVLGRAEGALGRAALLAAEHDSNLSETQRKAASAALGAGGKSSLGPISAAQLSTMRERVAQTVKLNPLAESASIREVEAAFSSGQLWLAAKLAERLPLGPARSGSASQRLTRILAWLQSDELIQRLATTGGLGRRLITLPPCPDQERIVSALEEQYRVEPAPSVRRAIVIALGRVPIGQSGDRRVLALARRLDPDPTVRAAARFLVDSPDALSVRGSDGPPQAATGVPQHLMNSLDFAADGTPCFSSSECRVLPPKRADVPEPKP